MYRSQNGSTGMEKYMIHISGMGFSRVQMANIWNGK